MNVRFPFVNKLRWSDILFGIFVVLLLIPQTRRPIQVAVNKAKLWVWSPSVEGSDDRVQLSPFDYKVQNLNGEVTQHRIGDGQITFLSFWATWCAPCLAELPSIQKLYQDYGNRVNFVLVTREDTAMVQAFMAQKDYELPVYFPRSQVPEVLQSNSLPTNYLIDGRGQVLIAETGAANWNSQKVRVLLDGLLNE